MVAVSVVVPLYNKEREIARCIESILRQTYADFEIIVIDDGSTDRGAKIARSFEDARLIVLSQQNIGVAGARNSGTLAGTGQTVAFMDADDAWLPEHLADVVGLYADCPRAGAAATAHLIGRGNFLRPMVMPSRHIAGDRTLIDYFSSPLGMLHPSAFSVTREAFDAVGGFYDMVGEDTDFILRIAAHYPIVYELRPTVVWHVDATNRSSGATKGSLGAHRIGSFDKSLALIHANENIARAVKADAERYACHWERRAITSALRQGRSEEAKNVYHQWSQRFARHDRALAFALALPRPLTQSTLRLGNFVSRLNRVQEYGLGWLKVRFRAWPRPPTRRADNDL